MLETKLKQRRTEYCQALEETLNRLLDHLTKMPEVEKVILFGSYAAGRRDLFTDLDILVVMDTQESFLERTAGLYRQISIDVDMDLLVYLTIPRSRSFSQVEPPPIEPPNALRATMPGTIKVRNSSQSPWPWNELRSMLDDDSNQILRHF
jgi:predicted nucleotidyltransferase